MAWPWDLFQRSPSASTISSPRRLRFGPRHLPRGIQQITSSAPPARPPHRHAAKPASALPHHPLRPNDTSGVGAHGAAHSYIGGNLGDPHLSFRDPFVFLLHSNIDRLWAMWQRQPGHPERLDPAQVYDTEENSTTVAGRNDVEVGEPYWGIQLRSHLGPDLPRRRK